MRRGSNVADPSDVCEREVPAAAHGVALILFETDKKPLTFLLDQIDQRELSLPDFQRSFVWDPNATRELAISVVQSFPAGTLLFKRGGAHVFAPRDIEEAPELNSKKPSYLVRRPAASYVAVPSLSRP